MRRRIFVVDAFIIRAQSFYPLGRSVIQFRMFGKIPSRWVFVEELEKPKAMHFAAGNLLKKPAAPANSNQTVDFLQQLFR
jgi:hypothetical protein